MKNIGPPFVIQNTNLGWLVTWSDAAQCVEASTEQVIESVSFSVVIPKRANLTISEVESFALKRAIELLQEVSRRHAIP